MVMSNECDKMDNSETGDNVYNYDLREGIKQENSRQSISKLSRALISVRGDESNFMRVQNILVEKNYEQFRLIDRNGNCMYQAFLFAVLDKLSADSENGSNEFAQHLLKVAERTKKGLAERNYSMVVVEDFVDNFEEFLGCYVQSGDKDSNNGQNEFYEQFSNDTMQLKYCIQFVRLAVSNYVQDNEALYRDFFDEKSGLREYCSKVVESGSEYGDEIQFNAMCSLFGMRGVIESVSKKADEYFLVPIEFNAGGEHPLYVLFFNHHYDMLYK